MSIAHADFIAGMAKGLAVLESFDTSRQRLNATLAAERAGLTRAAARHHLRTLAHLGYLETDGSATSGLPPKVLPPLLGSYLAFRAPAAGAAAHPGPSRRANPGIVFGRGARRRRSGDHRAQRLLPGARLRPAHRRAPARARHFHRTHAALAAMPRRETLTDMVLPLGNERDIDVVCRTNDLRVSGFFQLARKRLALVIHSSEEKTG